MNKYEQKAAPIVEALERFKRRRVVPFDVPGHKRGRGNPELVDLLGKQCVGLDVNSMKPLDNLGHPISVIKEAEEFLLKLASASEITFENDEKVIPKNAISIVADDIKAFIPFEELVDLDEERKRLEAEKKKLEAEVERSNKILSNKGFLAKAPKEKVQEEEAKKVKYEAMLNETIARLSSIK